MNMTSNKANLLSVVWHKNPDVIERMIEGEAVLLDLKSGVYYSLNETGTIVWCLLAGQVSTGELVQSIAEKYESGVEQIENAVMELMLELESQKLVSRVEVDSD